MADLTRRTILTGTAVAVPTLLGSLPALGRIEHPDATLLALGEALRASWAAETLAFARAATMTGRARESYPQAFLDASGAIVASIVAHRATTTTGLAVKLCALLWTQGTLVEVATPLSVDRGHCMEDRIIQSAAADVLTLWENHAHV